MKLVILSTISILLQIFLCQQIRATSKNILELLNKGDIPNLQQFIKVEGDKLKAKLDNGKPILVHAVEVAVPEIVEELLKSGKVDPNEKGPDGLYPIHIAAKRGSPEIVHSLVRHKALTDKPADGSGYFAVHYAAEGSTPGHTKVLQEIVSEAQGDLDVFTKTSNPLTALMIAAEKGNQNTVEYLMSHANKIDQKDKNGNTALHKAVVKATNVSIVTLILEGGASVEQKNNEGKTAKDLALKNPKLANEVAIFEEYAIPEGYEKESEHEHEHEHEHGKEGEHEHGKEGEHDHDHDHDNEEDDPQGFTPKEHPFISEHEEL